LKKPAAERLKLLRESTNPQAAFLWALMRNSFHYAAVHLADIAHSARDIDFAMRWGFGLKQGSRQTPQTSDSSRQQPQRRRSSGCYACPTSRS
jgi:hypothetical protein